MQKRTRLFYHFREKAPTPKRKPELMARLPLLCNKKLDGLTNYMGFFFGVSEIALIFAVFGTIDVEDRY